MTRLRPLLLLIALLGAAALSHAETSISDTITTTTWTKAAGPYSVVGTVTIPAGNTLTIEAGVDVWFDVDVQFVVEGALRAHGTETDSVRFLPREADEWAGIRVCSEDSSSLEYTRVSGAKGNWYGGGIGTGWRFARLAMAHCVVSQNSAVYQGGGIANWGTIHLTDCTIRDNSANTGGGVYNDGTATFVNCAIARNAAVSQGGGMVSTGWQPTFCSLTMMGCAVEGNRSGGWSGGLFNESPATLTSCRFLDNIAADAAGGICTREPPGAYSGAWPPTTIDRCIVSGNEADFGGGICTYGAAALRNCTIVGNVALTGGGGVLNGCYTHATLTNCIVWDNTKSDVSQDTRFATLGSLTVSYTCVGGGYEGKGNTGSDPLFVDVAARDFRLQPASPCRDTGDPYTLDRDESPADMGATGGGLRPFIPRMEVLDTSLDVCSTPAETLRVANTDWADLTVSVELPASFTSPLTFPHAVPAGDTLRIPILYSGTDVATGSATVTGSDAYSDPVTIDLRGLPGTALKGTLGTTTLSATGSSYRVTEAVTVPARSTLTIEAGVDVLFDADVGLVVYGALRVHGTMADSVRLLRGDTAEWEGICIAGSDSSALSYARVSGASGNDYQDITCGGGVDMVGVGARMTMEHCVVSGNRAAGHGGGLGFRSEVTARLTDCLIAGNRADGGGGGIYIDKGAISLRNCMVRDNVAAERGGGVLATTPGVRFIDCAILGNSAPEGGGVACEWPTSVLTLRNCTINGNRGGGVLAKSSGYVDVRNCILRWDSQPEICERDGGAVTVTYSCVHGGWEGEGNIDADPLFTDPGAGDLSLRPGSPCIDAGDPAFTDPDGSRSDMGAAWKDGLLTDATGRLAPFTLSQNLPNPFNPVTMIPYSITETKLVTLSVYNLQGQLVQTLVQEIAQPGEHYAVWDGRDFAGRAAASGVYLYRLTAPDGAMTRRMTLVR